MSSLPQDPHERRRYYRIEDWVALEIVPESSDQRLNTALFSLLSEFHQLDSEQQVLLRQLADTDRILANYLRLQNRRMELLARALSQELERQMSPPRRVNLSEEGICFTQETPLPEQQSVYLYLVLSQAVELCLKAQVTRCLPLEQGQYELALYFEELSESNRQLLARHILQKQAQERRMARGERS
ncbi:PilZ domain-containing protein [Azomonas agilis]|uniref:PilZ domain-containing protein n=1 Tax=Azomonas agilis TaxID=116849 RepID=A0A562I0C4_9GAMM|nr:PilZ domain-containing protein [Azomonas agilis]TWH64509.1 PilZ domain-containing protein [Azomonas agilis]